MLKEIDCRRNHEVLD